jgi:hypothetical protein
VTPLALYRAELNERLVVHLTGGDWRVPLSTRHLDVVGLGGARLGRIVCGDAADAARAVAGLAGAPAAPTPEHLRAALEPWAGVLDGLRAIEGGGGLRPPAALPAGQGPVLIVSGPDHDLPALIQIIAQSAQRGAVWAPEPRAAASAHLVARALVPVLGRALSLVQGDGATRAALLAAGLSPAA